MSKENLLPSDESVISPVKLDGESGADAIRRMNPGVYIPTGAELAKAITDREAEESNLQDSE